MCASRHWKRIETFIFDETVNIVGTRSDDLLITSQAVFETGNTAHQIVSKVADAMKRLESFRNCKCTSEETCEKHG